MIVLGFLFVLGLVLWLPARRHRRQPAGSITVTIVGDPTPPARGLVTDEAIAAWLADEPR